MTLPLPIQELIDSSGNSFDAKVAQWFSANGWQLQVSPYYLDPVQDKAREVDLLCEKAWVFKNMFGNPEGHVIVRLYVECKWLPGHAVFWFSDRSTREAKAMLAATGVFPSNNTYSEQHHHLDPGSRVAKLFASSQNKQQETDIFYKALNQVLSAYTAFRAGPSAPTSLEHSLRGKKVVLQYPLIVCSSFKNVYAADFNGKDSPGPLTRNFAIEVQYAYGGGARTHANEYFLVDVSSFDTLPALATSIEQDVEAAIALSASS